jgi:hypothetical protein
MTERLIGLVDTEPPTWCGVPRVLRGVTPASAGRGIGCSHKGCPMKMLQGLCVAAALLVATGCVLSPPVYAQDPGAPCGRDANGSPLQCVRPDPGVNLESACLTTGRVQNCLPYHQHACEIRGFPLACRLYNLGRHCYGGDPNTCDYYVSLLRANTQCTLDRNPQACLWLQQQQF